MLEKEYYDHLSNIIVDYIQADDHQFKVRMHYHNGYEIFFFKKATAQLLINHQVCAIRDGDILLINPYIMHTAYRLAPGFYERYYINIATGLVWQALQRLGLESVQKQIGASAHLLLNTGASLNLQMQSRFEVIYHQFTRHPAFWQERMAGEMALLLGDIEEHCQTSQAPGIRQINETSLNKILAYIDDHLHAQISLEDLEQQFYVTRFHICRLFRKETGLTFSQYVNRKKIIIAQQILNNSTASVTEACQASGFHHLQYFTKVFKEVTQLTPSEYQRQKTREYALYQPLQPLI